MPMPWNHDLEKFKSALLSDEAIEAAVVQHWGSCRDPEVALPRWRKCLEAAIDVAYEKAQRI